MKGTQSLEDEIPARKFIKSCLWETEGWKTGRAQEVENQDLLSVGNGFHFTLAQKFRLSRSQSSVKNNLGPHESG